MYKRSVRGHARAMPITKRPTHRAIRDAIVVDGFAVVSRYLPVDFVAVTVRRIDVVVRVHVLVDQNFGFLGSRPLGHRALLLTAPIAFAHVVYGGESELIGLVGFQSFQNVRRVCTTRKV